MRYFIGFLIVIGLVLLAIILLVRLLFGGGEPQVKNTESLTTYANTSTVMQLTIEGPVVADQDYRQIQIDVGNTSNEIRMIVGYENNVFSRQSFASNPNAYATFLRAIDLLGYTNGNPAEDQADDRGYCPQGNRFIFSIVDGNETKQRFWSTNCGGGGLGTFNGQAETIIALYKAQIPGYSNLTSQFGLQ